MLVTDLTQQDLEDLKLPMVLSAVEDKPDTKIVRPILNIKHTGAIIVKREVLMDPEVSEDAGKVEAYLVDQARMMPKKPLNEDGTGPLLPDNPLMIRADQNTPFKYIQRIMEICGKKGIQIWKLELGAAEDPAVVEARKAEEGK
jgi:hypothetical protein